MDIQSAKKELATLTVTGSNLVENIKSTGRDLTDTELHDLERDTARILELKGMIAFLEKNPTGDPRQFGAGPAGLNQNDGYGRFGEDTPAAKGVFSTASIKATAQRAVEPMAKALVAGGSSANPVTLDANPLRLATPPANLGILGVLPVVKRKSPDYSYQRQSLRTNNAAVVAPGALKPVSVYTTETIKASLQVVAHTSEYVDTYQISDNDFLAGFLQSELVDGLFAKVTANVVAAIAGTAGIQTQAFTNNVMDSLYLGGSKALDLGYNPDVVLLSRATFDALVLAKDTAGNYLYKRDEDSRLHGLYPVIATGLPANSAIVLDSNKVGISTDEDGVLTKWDPYTKLDYNQIRALVEGRFQTDVTAAPAIVKVSLVAV